MFNLTQISSDILYLFLAFVGIDYSDNAAIAEAKMRQNNNVVAMQVNFETKLSKFSTKISASGMPVCNKSNHAKPARLKKWRLSITP